MEPTHRSYSLKFGNHIINDKRVRKFCAWEDEKYTDLALLLGLLEIYQDQVHACIETLQEVMDSGISNSIEVDYMTLEISSTTTNLFENVEPLDSLLIDTGDLLNILREWSDHLEILPKEKMSAEKELYMNSHAFKNISLRGRTGYVLCCLENTIAHQGLNHPRWQIVLDVVWKGTEEDIWNLEYEFQCISPKVISYYPNFAAYTRIYPPSTNPQDEYRAQTEAEFNELQTIYQQSEVANTLPTYILDMSTEPIYFAILDEVSLGYIDEIIHLMNVHSIPLPNVNLFTFSTPNAGTGDPLLGAPFTRADIFGPKV